MKYYVICYAWHNLYTYINKYAMLGNSFLPSAKMRAKSSTFEGYFRLYEKTKFLSIYSYFKIKKWGFISRWKLLIVLFLNHDRETYVEWDPSRSTISWKLSCYFTASVLFRVGKIVNQTENAILGLRSL